jgi:hypothetical protein
VNLLGARVDRPLADSCSAADIARLTGLTRGRIAQLRASTGPDALPEPDAAGSTAQRPLWRGDTVARWCAHTGRRLPARTASWLLPGPDGPRLRHTGHTIARLEPQPEPHAEHDALRRRPIDVHIARYATTDDHGPCVWLATVLAPDRALTLLDRLHERHHSPLHHLAHHVLATIEPTMRPTGELLGTVVLLPTTAAPRHLAPTDHPRLLDLYRTDTPGGTNGRARIDDLHERLRPVRPDDDELRDLVRAIGHRLPWWPPGCASPDLVAGRTPDTTATTTRVPPPVADAQAFLRRCERAAADLTGSLRASVLDMGHSWWGLATDGWRRDRYPDHLAPPADFDPAIWQVAAEFTLPTTPSATGDFWEGLDWVLEHAPSMRLADEALRLFGDPAVAGTAVLDTTTLPDPIAAALTERAPLGASTDSHRARRVLEALDAHPHAAAGPVLGTWPATVGPAWCAHAPGTSLVAVHVPRVLPDPGRATGTPLEIVLTRTESPHVHASPKAVGFVITDTDAVLLLPALGDSGRLAAAIEHAVWHPGTPTLAVGLSPSPNPALTAAVDALVDTGPCTTPWERLAALVGPHPTDGYCPYCPAHPIVARHAAGHASEE